MAFACAGLVVLGLVLTWVAAAWHGLVQARDSAERTWAAIDGHLTDRHRLVPALIAAVHDVAPGETIVLEALAAARAATLTAAGAFAQADAERRLVAALERAATLTEHHPILGATAPFVDVQTRLALVDDALAATRRVYNADVRLYLRRRRRAPATWITRFGDFPERPYFELDHTRARPVTLRAV